MIGSSRQFDAVVVGASWAGIWCLYLLKRQGLRVLLVDACSDVGGVWHYTHYPGCRVDTEVPFYEFSLPELWKEWEWSERFPARAEIQKYLGWVCDRLDLRRHIMQDTRVTGAHWKETTNSWAIFSDDGLIAETKFFLPCSGYSTIRQTPAFPGQDTFKTSFHSSNFPKELDYKNKRVGIIGTAASGIQCIENMVGEVSKLVVFQRTPNLATPMRQERYTDERREDLKSDYPELFKKRRSRYGFGNAKQTSHQVKTFDHNPEQRRQFYEDLYSRGGLAFWFDNYSDLLTSEEANNEAYAFWRDKTRARISDAAVAKILAPTKAPHAYGTKRPSLETAYFEAFNQSHVKLVDLKQEPIHHVTSLGIQTRDRFFDLDVIIYATGFDFITGSMLAMGIRGKDGLLLNDRWKMGPNDEGVLTYLGLMTNGYPNMFFPMGPQAPSALGLTPHMAEIQGAWISACISHMQRLNKVAIEPTEDAELEWKHEVNAAAEQSLLGKTDSWYMGVNIIGRKREALCYFGGVDRYIEFLEDSINTDFPDFEFTTDEKASHNLGWLCMRPISLVRWIRSRFRQQKHRINDVKVVSS